jgi:hypothetical protein
MLLTVLARAGHLSVILCTTFLGPQSIAGIQLLERRRPFSVCILRKDTCRTRHDGCEVRGTRNGMPGAASRLLSQCGSLSSGPYHDSRIPNKVANINIDSSNLLICKLFTSRFRFVSEGQRDDHSLLFSFAFLHALLVITQSKLKTSRRRVVS